jgi:drug/metabolite transporter (DMT)-like permease
VPEERTSRIIDAPESKIWVFYGLGAGCLLAGQNILYSLYAQEATRTRTLYGMGIFVFSFVWWIVHFALEKKKTGKFPSWSTSNFYNKKNEGGINWAYVLGIVLDNVFLFFTLYFVVLSFKYSQLADMNTGITTIIFSLNSTLVFITAYIFFHESMKRHHFIALVVMSLAILLICLRGFALPDIVKPVKPDDPVTPEEPKESNFN